VIDVLRPVRGLGAAGIGAALVGREGASIFARTVRASFRGRREPGEVVAQMHEIGNRSFVFVGTTLGFLGMVLVYQVCMQIQAVIGDLSQVGAEFLRALVHQFGPTLTGMMLATRVGAGIAAEVGSMVVTEQVDALRMCAADPIEYLVVPRFKGGIIATTTVIIWSALVAWTSGMLTAWSFFGVLPRTFANTSMVGVGDLVVGLTKCLAYGAAIPVVSAQSGLSTFGGSEGVGWATTRAVVNSSLAVIVLNFFISAAGLVLFP
jgi:phospholipid/cholesterol/gamma-HCH transport system permease protein